MTVLTTHDLGKHFGGQDIFSHLNLAVNQGDRVALVGANGEGKTTLLKILAGLEPLGHRVEDLCTKGLWSVFNILY